MPDKFDRLTNVSVSLCGVMVVGESLEEAVLYQKGERSELPSLDLFNPTNPLDRALGDLSPRDLTPSRYELTEEVFIRKEGKYERSYPVYRKIDAQ